MRRREGLVAALLVMAACAQPGQPPVAERSPVFGAPDRYRVEVGDTLYSIAWRFGLDYRALARANGIAPPFVIYTGQQLRLAEAPAARPVPAQPERGRGAGREAPRRPTAPVAGWVTPTDAPLRRGFGNGNRGLDYRLEAGHRVMAAAAGTVVYAGSGLGGYRHLIILAHDPRYLSAYSLDRPIAVAEGESVKAGAILADIDTGRRRAGTLHFEIRKDGDPVDPGPLIGSG